MKDCYLNKIFYRKNGFSSKKTLVFIHGLSGSSSAWKQYENFFSREYNVLTFDLRGHGKSHKPQRFMDYKMEEFAEDLFKIIKHEKIKRFSLISHSFGNFTALEFLKRHPRMVEKVVFLSGSHCPCRRRIARIIKPALKAFSYLDFFPIRKKKGHVDYTKHVMTGDWNIPRMIDDISNTTLRVYLYGTLQSFYVSSEGFLPKIKQPTLIIHGGKDTIFPLSDAKKMSMAIRDCKMTVLKDANHILVLNNFKEVSKLIRDFIG
jgi:pimeloyl-ACP methyl ester carboxylesterase